MLTLARYALISIGLFFGSGTMLAAQTRLYSDKELQEARHTYEPNVRDVFRLDLIQQLPKAQRQSLSNVTLRMPLYGKHVLQYSARMGDRSVIVPVMSVKFLDDMTIAWAWFTEKGCDASYLTSYLSLLLRYNDIGVNPLAAFGLPRTIIKNKRVNDLSLKLSKTALYFLLAHEAGHLFYNHQPARGFASQRQEQQADDFALSAMARVGVVPAGIIPYFIAAYMYEPLPELETWEFRTGVVAELTHPLTSTRVRRIAQRLAARPMDYAHSEPDPRNAAERVKYIARQITEIADHMDHGGLRLYSASWLIRHFPKDKFSVACPAS